MLRELQCGHSDHHASVVMPLVDVIHTEAIAHWLDDQLANFVLDRVWVAIDENETAAGIPGDLAVDEQRAAAITSEWKAVIVACEATDSRSSSSEVCIGGDMVYVVTQQIADAIRAAVEDVRRRAAVVARSYAERNATCPPGCRCGDGHHVAAAIEQLEV